MVVRALCASLIILAGAAFVGAVAEEWPHALFLLAPAPFGLAATLVLMPDIERMSRWRRRRRAAR